MLILFYSLASQSPALTNFTGINIAKCFLPKYIHSASKGFPTDRFPEHRAKTKRCSINTSNSIYKSSI